jgi:GDP-mannose 6-dehydrogenase
MKISVFGLGYVGAVSLACLARDGHELIGVDVDQAKLDLIMAGKTPVVEEGMVDLMMQVAQSGRVKTTMDVSEALNSSELSMICVGTPSSPNGSQDQGAILSLARDLGRVLRDMRQRHTFVFRSTVVPGTVEDLLCPMLESESGKKEGVDFDVCFQPEFLREGSSIRDYDRPPFTIVGTSNLHAVGVMRALLGHLPCEFFQTSIRAAEAVKYACNNFHALKITFANETARLCEALGVDPFEVMDLVCRDTQLNISRAYLRPGFAFGGSCLPKDLRATMHIAKTRDVEVPMLGAILASNRVHLEHAINKILASGKRRIGMIGLSFKSGTDDLRESPLVYLAEQLIGKGLNLLVYDPEVMLSQLLGANRRFIEQHVPHIGTLLRSDLSQVIEQSDLLVVGLSGADITDTLAKHSHADQPIIDLVNLGSVFAQRENVEGLCW